MPLAFASQSHGTIAFGFFNIETDMLLLERCFFFADRFCQAIIDLDRATVNAAPVEVPLPGWRIADQTKVGNLHGAIDGLDLSGFIGATYARFPFPRSPAGFKQDPEGLSTQPIVTEMIASFGVPEDFALSWDPSGETVSMAEYRFDRRGFAALIAYVDRGGYPRWRDEVRPDYVQRMMEQLRQGEGKLVEV